MDANSAYTPINCGSWPASDGPAQPASPVSDPPPSRAGSLPHWISGGRKFRLHPNQLWERACSRRGRPVQHQCRLTHRFREQARSHTGSSVDANSASTPINCGSWPASDGPAQPASPMPDPPPSRAGSLPHWIFGGRKFRLHPDQLWERACSRRGRPVQHQCRLTHRFREQARSHSRRVGAPPVLSMSFWDLMLSAIDL